MGENTDFVWNGGREKSGKLEMFIGLVHAAHARQVEKVLVICLMRTAKWARIYDLVRTGGGLSTTRKGPATLQKDSNHNHKWMKRPHNEVRCAWA